MGMVCGYPSLFNVYIEWRNSKILKPQNQQHSMYVKVSRRIDTIVQSYNYEICRIIINVKSFKMKYQAFDRKMTRPSSF